MRNLLPVQHPANDVNSDFITTHFDYHSIDGNLLKLDILGHDDPTMIRMLEDLTGIDAKTIPLDDKALCPCSRVPRLSESSRKALEGVSLDALESRNSERIFAMQMLIDTQPKYLSDLVRIPDFLMEQMYGWAMRRY